MEAEEPRPRCSPAGPPGRGLRMRRERRSMRRRRSSETRPVASGAWTSGEEAVRAAGLRRWRRRPITVAPRVATLRGGMGVRGPLARLTASLRSLPLEASNERQRVWTCVWALAAGFLGDVFEDLIDDEVGLHAGY